MPDLPKIARQRLEEISRAEPSAQTGPEGTHPDLNLLAAFAERSIPPQEHENLISHLAGCAECREILRAATALETQGQPEISADLPAREAVATRSSSFQWVWTRWTGLGLGLATATAVLIVTAAWLRRSAVYHPGGEAQVAMSRANRVPAKEQERQTAAATREVGPSPSSVAKPERKKMGSARPPSPSRGREPAGEPQTGAVSESLQDLAVGASPADRTAGQVRQEAGVPTAPAPRASQTNRPQETAAAAPHVSGFARGLAGARSKVRSQALNIAPSLAMTAGASTNAQIKWLVATQSSGGTAAGRLERSVDGGRTWEVVHVDDSASFSVVAHEGLDVWVGGASGALFHSPDLGLHWQRVQVISGNGGPSLTGAVSGISVLDALHVVVSTDTHEAWNTADGGVTWESGR